MIFELSPVISHVSVATSVCDLVSFFSTYYVYIMLSK